LIVGYRLDDRLSIGLGTGAHFNNRSTGSFFSENDFIPVYAYIRRYQGTHNWGPFLFTKIGYGFPMGRNFVMDDFSGGFFAQPGIGLHFASRGRYRFIMSLSNYVQYTKGSQRNRDFVFNNPIDIKYKVWYNRLMFKVGVEFR